MAANVLDAALRDRIRGHLGRFEARSEALAGRRHAAVAIALVDDDDGRACFVLTRRAARMRDHAGQWALPGGRLDGDETAPAAALRELDEEVGLRLEPDAVLGQLDDYPTRSGFVITPVVVWGGSQTRLVPDPTEVHSVYRVPVAQLMRRDIPVLRAIPESDRPLISVALLGSMIHAPTAAVLYQMREVALAGRDTRVSHFEQPVFAWR